MRTLRDVINVIGLLLSFIAATVFAIGFPAAMLWAFVRVVRLAWTGE